VRADTLSYAAIPPSRLKALGAESVEKSLAPIPASSLYFAANKERLEAARSAIEATRRKAQKDIADRLREAAIRDVRRIQDAKEQALEEEHRILLDSVFGQLREIFMKYAPQAGIATFELSALVGFPDPDPNSKGEPDADEKVALRRFQRAKSLRAMLASLDRQFFAEFDALLANTEEHLKKSLASLRLELAELLELYMAQAAAEAERLTQQTDQQITAAADVSDVNMPGVRGSRAQISSPGFGPVAAGIPRMDFPRPLETELLIFLETHRYKLSSSPLDPDATNEFISWRRRFVSGN